MQCSVVYSLQLYMLNKCTFFSDNESSGLPTLEYSCTLTPLFSIELLSNQSYILQLNFSPPTKNASSSDAFETTSRPAVIKEVSLTIIGESYESFDRKRAFVKYQSQS